MKRRTPKTVPHADFILSLGLFGWGLLMAWIAFGGTRESEVALVVASLFFMVSFGTPVVLARIADFTNERQRERATRREIETHTGSIRTSAARVETLLPVIGVAVGFTLIGLVFISV